MKLFFLIFSPSMVCDFCNYLCLSIIIYILVQIKKVTEYLVSISSKKENFCNDTFFYNLYVWLKKCCSFTKSWKLSIKKQNLSFSLNFVSLRILPFDTNNNFSEICHDDITSSAILAVVRTIFLHYHNLKTFSSSQNLVIIYCRLKLKF